MKKLLLISATIAVFTASCKKDKPATVASLTTTATTNLTANSVTTGGNITNDGRTAITKRGVAWATHTAPTVADSITNDGTGAGSFISNVSGLMANANYYIRAYAINGTGTTYGNEISVTTPKGLATITTTSISSNQALTAQSGGNLVSDGGATVTERGVVWSTTPHPTTSNFKATVAGAGTGTFTAALTNLSLTTYYVRAYAINSFGTSYGNEISFTVSSTGTVTDYDGNVYGTVVIGAQTWMTSNLKVTHYRNGDPIKNGSTNWYVGDYFLTATATDGAYTYPNNNASNNDNYGKYYDVLAVLDSRGVCPAGWHVPTDRDLQTLEFNQGMSASDTGSTNINRGTIANKFLEGGSSGLNLQKAGFLQIDLAVPTSTSYLRFNTEARYWTSTSVGDGGTGLIAATELYYRGFAGPATPAGSIIRTYNSDGMGTSIRCVKN